MTPYNRKEKSIKTRCIVFKVGNYIDNNYLFNAKYIFCISIILDACVSICL